MSPRMISQEKYLLGIHSSNTGGGNDNPLQYSYLENTMDRGAWRAAVHDVTKDWAQLKLLSTAHSSSEPYVLSIPG